MKILIAEDNPASRKLLQAQLEAEGHGVLAAADGVEALAVLQRETVDAIISDILMPRMDGYRLCYEVRKDERLRRLPFIFYTSTYTSPSDEKFAGDLTADRFLKKPASLEMIVEALQSVLHQENRAESPPTAQVDELDLLKEYSQRLVAKLEDKIIELEKRSQELRDSHGQLRQVLDHSPVVIYALDVEGGKIVPRLVSENITALLGFTVPEAQSYEWWFNQLHAEDRGRAVASVSETLQQGRSLTEYRLRHKNGSYRWVEDKRRLVRNSSNQPETIFGVWTDITERRKAEEVLLQVAGEKASQGKMRAAKDLAIIVSLSVLAVGVTWRFILFHVPLHWIVRHEETLLDEAIVGLAVILLGLVWFGFRRWYHETHVEEALWGLHGELETRVQQRTLELVQANKALRAEINERMRAEETSRRLADIVESSNDAIIGETLDGTVTSWNKAAENIFGYTAAEMLGRSMTVLLPPDRPAEERAILDHVGGGEVFHLETRRVRKDGVQIDIAATVSPIKDAQGLIVGASKIGRDITARKKTELELEQTHNQLLAFSRQAGIAVFATGILHNVGNVLNSVNTASACLAQSLKKSELASLGKLVALLREHESDLGGFFANNPKGKLVPDYLAKLAGHLTGENARALEELGRLQEKIEHIKDIVRMQQDSARVRGTSERLDVTRLVEDALEMNANALARDNIQVVREFSEIPLIPIQKHSVLQILVNLVRNALQACDGVELREKRLTARVSQNNGSVRVAITDTGCGISPEHLAKICTHGFTTKKDGHGFGLHSAQLSAKEIGGSLTVHSDGPDKGATFTLELPVEGAETFQTPGKAT